MFTTRTGQPVRQGTFQGSWAKATEKRSASAGALASIRFHDLRHFYASALIASGCSVPAVQHALGHASATEILNTYAHL